MKLSWIISAVIIIAGLFVLYPYYGPDLERMLEPGKPMISINNFQFSKMTDGNACRISVRGLALNKGETANSILLTTDALDLENKTVLTKETSLGALRKGENITFEDYLIAQVDCTQISTAETHVKTVQ